MKGLKLLMYIIFLVISGTYLPGCEKQPGSDSHDHNLDTPESTHTDVNDQKDEEYEDEEYGLDHEDHEHEEQSGEIILEPGISNEVDIEVAPVSKRYIEKIKTYPGTIVPLPDGEALVGSLVGGRMLEIPVGLGDIVSKGSPLCSFESPDIGEAQSAYIRAVAENQLSQKDFIRQKILRSENIVSEKILLEKEANAQSAQAELAAAERALYSIGFTQSEIEILLLNHSTTGILTLRSPIAGTVVNRAVRLGQRIEPEDDLFHIVDLSRLWVQMSLYESDLAHIRLNQVVDIIPQSLPGKAFQGRVVRIGKEVDKETRTVDCYVEIANKEGLLIPNLFVTCRVQVDALADQVLAVPEESVVLDEHGDMSVYVEHEPYNFVIREVELGRSSEGWIEVIDGLTEGERVVFKGSFFIKSEVAKGSFGHGHEH